MNIAELITLSSNEFFNNLKNDENGRYRSWEHCYYEFHNARNKELSIKEIEHLALHLSFYLASWGMYRGSSFLLQKDYKVHIPAVKEILSTKYNALFGIKCCDFQIPTNQSLLIELNTYLENYYNKIRLSVLVNTPKNKLSDTLITKILMGTLGCVPAYDRYFNYGIKKHNIASSNYNIKSILAICQFYEVNKITFDKACSRMNINGIPYPQMKFLDMGFWEIGYRDDVNNNLK